jgi:hypothetical protein
LSSVVRSAEADEISRNSCAFKSRTVSCFSHFCTKLLYQIWSWASSDGKKSDGIGFSFFRSVWNVTLSIGMLFLFF